MTHTLSQKRLGLIRIMADTIVEAKKDTLNTSAILEPTH